MGLDWNPLARPKAGQEEEYRRLFHQLEASSPPPDELMQRFQEISEAPFTTLGAPRVGFDAAADAWLMERLEQNGQSAELAAAKEQMHGYYVLDLLPGCDGFPVYTHYGMYEGLDRYSFRGKFLDDVADIIGPELMERAYTRMLAPELKDFGERLLQHARALAKKHQCEEIESLRDTDHDPETPQSRVHILFAAARWCLYWAERGFGLDPWF